MRKLLNLVVLLLFVISTSIFIFSYDLGILNDLEYVNYWNNPTSENIEKFKNYNGKYFKLEKDRTIKDIPFETEIKSDKNIPQGSQYIILGEEGKLVNDFDLLSLNWNGRYSEKILNSKEFTINSLSEKVFKGERNVEEFDQFINSHFSNFLSALANRNTELFVQTSNEEGIDLNAVNYVENVNLSEVVSKDIIELESDSASLVFAGIKISIGNCRKESNINLRYFYKTGEFKFTEIKDFVNSLCPQQVVQIGNTYLANCSDCTWYPANKVYGLRPDYAPPVVYVGEIPGGQYIHQNAYADLIDMYNNAVASGYAMALTSGYRSYYTQYNTFEAWVATEMANGHDRATAEVIANSYSARPGFSEHQLGTTADITNTGCNLSGGCDGNNDLWSWLRNNAYKYGFALSYPQGMEGRTGYIYEPWHYRWIGRDLALEYKSQEGNLVLQEFLLQKGLY